MYQTIILLILLLFASHHVHAETKNCESLDIFFTVEQAKALLDFDRLAEDHSVSVIHGTVGGRDKTIVLVGEQHVHDQLTEEALDHLLLQFPAVGLEGANVGAYFKGEWAMNVIAHTYTRYAKDNDQVVGSQSRFLAEVALQEQIKNVVGVLAYQALSTHSDEELRNIRYEIGDAVVDGVEIRKAFEVQREAFQLEHGHKPSVREQIELLGIAVLFKFGPPAAVPLIACSAVACTAALIEHAPEAALTGLGLFVARGLLSALVKPLITQVGRARKFVFNAQLSLLENRNSTMVDNTIKAITEGDDAPDRIVLLVGRKHVSGMIDLFTGQHGFTSVPFR